MNSVKIRSFFWPVFSRIRTEYRDILSLRISPNAEKYGPERTPYLDTFHKMNLWISVCLICCTGTLKETIRWLLFGNSWSGFFQGIACVIVWKHLILLDLWNGLQLLLSIDKSYAHSYSYRSKYHWDQYLPYIYCNDWLMTALSHWDLFILFWEHFPSSVHELCGGIIFLLYLCNELLASFRFDEKHDLVSLFLVSSVMEELWFNLILRYYMQQFHFAHDGQTGSHLCTSYRRTSNRLSHTNSASTLVPKSVV